MIYTKYKASGNVKSRKLLFWQKYDIIGTKKLPSFDSSFFYVDFCVY